MSLNEFEKGLFGEMQVDNFLQFSMPEVKSINNISIPKRQSSEDTTQIDFLLFCKKGFFCLEVKTWRGVITSLDDNFCMVEVNDRTIHRPNPITQNRTHVRALKSLTGYKFIPLIVFVGSTLINGFNNTACTLANLRNTLDLFNENYSDEQINDAYEYFTKLKEETVFSALGKHLGQLYNVKNRRQ